MCWRCGWWNAVSVSCSNNAMRCKWKASGSVDLPSLQPDGSLSPLTGIEELIQVQKKNELKIHLEMFSNLFSYLLALHSPRNSPGGSGFIRKILLDFPTPLIRHIFLQLFRSKPQKTEKLSVVMETPRETLNEAFPSETMPFKTKPIICACWFVKINLILFFN